MMNKEKIEYRRGMTERLRGIFREDRFCRATTVLPNGRHKGA